MRNKLWLLSAFTLAATLPLGAHDAEAKKASPKNISPATAYAINTKGCKFTSPPPLKEGGWKNARLTALLIRQANGSYEIAEILNSKNPDQRLPAASLSKWMTASVYFKMIDQRKLDMDAEINVTKESLCLRDNKFAVEGLPAGITKIKRGHAMSQMLKKSSNTMAENISIDGEGSIKKFVDDMNATAISWGMKDTRFLQPHGIPEGDRQSEYTTAHDMLIMAQHISSDIERFKEYGNAKLETWIIPETYSSAKLRLKLVDMGAVFKTASIAQCSSLLTVLPLGEYVIVDVQLCGNAITKFENAIWAMTLGSKRINELALESPMMASEKQPKANAETVSLRQVQP